MGLEHPPFSNLDLIKSVDTWPFYLDSPEAYRHHVSDYYYFFIAGYGDHPFGMVARSNVRDDFWSTFPFWKVDHARQTLTLTPAAAGHDDTPAARTRLMETTIRAAYHAGLVPSDLVRYPIVVYDDRHGDGDGDGAHVVDVNGIGQMLFGLHGRSAHMLAWTMATGQGDDGRPRKEPKIWLLRRKRDARYHPGRLDNLVGKAMRPEEPPVDCIVRGAELEASLDPAWVRANAVACGTQTFHIGLDRENQEQLCYRSTQWQYEVELPPDMVPKFYETDFEEQCLMTLDEVRRAMRDGEFKGPSAMSCIAFLIRHGHMTAENEPDYAEICSRLHRRLELPYVPVQGGDGEAA